MGAVFSADVCSPTGCVDYRWTLSLWKNHMVCIIPRVNLVRNIGFDSQATHTVEHDFASLKMHEINEIKFPLVESKKNVFDAKMDKLVFQNHYHKLEGRRNLWKKIIDRVVRWLS